MAISRLISLYLSSLCMLLISCAVPLKYKLIDQRKILPGEVQPLVSVENLMLYKIQIFLFNKYYTGLLLHKQTDSVTSHLVFVTEVGLKMFDIEIKKDSLKMVYCFGPMNQPKITKLLENDMSVILLYQLLNKQAKVYLNEKKGDAICFTKENGRRYVYYSKVNSNRVLRSVVKGKLFTKQKTVYKYGADNLPESVSLKHKGLLRLKIELNRIITSKTND